ncbi:hypothetical protein ACL03H_07780 [Saccharopolyspora sp. MS10]|uniref:hypothetical protein n=1 Tax=Saccharopolyspora sp. MS10 TaxID=3385973 RepID=UPI0039A20342
MGSGSGEPAVSGFGLRIEHVAVGRGSAPALVILVDGEDLFGETLRLRGVGRDPDLLLGRTGALLPTEPPEQPRTALLRRCSCGIEGCGFASARIERDRQAWDHIVWTEFTLHCIGDAEPPGEIRFRTADYVAEIVLRHADRSWESTARRITREVGAALDADPGILGRWGCGLLRAQPDERNDATSLLITDGSADYRCVFDRAHGTAAIVDLLRSSDPRRSARHTFPRTS